jgi:hypothetical protein
MLHDSAHSFTVSARKALLDYSADGKGSIVRGSSMEPKTKLLDRMRNVMHLKRMSLHTEEAYVKGQGSDVHAERRLERSGLSLPPGPQAAIPQRLAPSMISRARDTPLAGRGHRLSGVSAGMKRAFGFPIHCPRMNTEGAQRWPQASRMPISPRISF